MKSSLPVNITDITIDMDVPDWSAYLAGHEQSTIYHDPRCGGILQRACGAEPYYLSARRDGKLVGVMTLLGQRSKLFGNRLCSIPYFDASGILADDAGAAEALISAADSLREKERYRSLEVRQFVPCAGNLPTRTDKVTLWLDLPDGAEAMWGQLKTKVRTKIRKSQKNPLEIVSGGRELLADFHAVYSRTMRDLGSPPHGRRIFEEILAEFPGESRLFVVRGDEKVLAASFTLQDKWGFHVPWSGSDVRFRDRGANRILYWEMLAYASNNGAKRFDFGRSTAGSGTYEFKREWGAEPVQLYWHYVLPSGEAMPENRPDNEKFGLMVKCWKKLPLPAARMLGPWIIRQLS